MNSLVNAIKNTVPITQLQNFTPAETIPAEDVYQKYGITDADLADFDEVYQLAEKRAAKNNL